MIEQPLMNNTSSEPLHSINDIWELISSDVPQVTQLYSNNNFPTYEIFVLNLYDTQYISNISLHTFKLQKKTFVCTATITDIVSRKGWNYISCSNCSKKLTKSGSSLNCQKCGKSQSVGVLRYY